MDSKIVAWLGRLKSGARRISTTSAIASLDSSMPPSAHCSAATSCGGVRSNWPSPAGRSPPRGSPGRESTGRTSSAIDMLRLRALLLHSRTSRIEIRPHGYDSFRSGSATTLGTTGPDLNSVGGRASGQPVDCASRYVGPAVHDLGKTLGTNHQHPR